MSSLLGGRQELLDLSTDQKVFYATIHSQCFHILYFTEAGERRKARENIGDFAGFFARYWAKGTFCRELCTSNRRRWQAAFFAFVTLYAAGTRSFGTEFEHY